MRLLGLLVGRSGLSSLDTVASCCRIQSNYMTLQRVNQELEDKLYRMVRPQCTLPAPSLSGPLRLVLTSGRCSQDENEVGSREAMPVQAARRMAVGLWHLLSLG